MNKSTKGKQATRGEKQILEENAATINYYFYVFAISNGGYLALQFLLFWDSFTTKFLVLYVLTALVAGIAYYLISYMGRPIRDEFGAVVGAGSDLNMQGHISEYAKDVVLFPCIVYPLTLFSNYFWLLLLIAPCYCAFKLWVNFLGPWFFAPGPEEDQSEDFKKATKQKTKIIRR